MSEAVGAINGDLARVSAAQAQLASAQSLEHASPEEKPSELKRARAAVQAAEAALAAAEAAVHADQAVPHISPEPHHMVDVVA